MNEPSTAPEMRAERVIDPHAYSTIKPAPLKTADPGQSAIKEELPLSPKLAALARKERENRHFEQKLKQEKQELESLRQKMAKYEEMEKKLTQKDYSAVDSLINYDDWTRYKLEQGVSVTPEQEKLRQLESKLDNVEKAHQEDTDRRFKAAVDERKRAVKQLGPEYSAIHKLQLEEAVVQHILDTFEHDGKEISVEEAAKDILEEAKRRRTLWSEAFTEPVPEEKELPPLKPQLKTLTNQMTAGELKRPVKSYQHMTDAERWAEARRRAEERLRK